VKKLVTIVIVIGILVALVAAYTKMGSTLMKAEVKHIETNVDLIKDAKSKVEKLNKATEDRAKEADETMQK
jgi:hypothetical protein